MDEINYKEICESILLFADMNIDSCKDLEPSPCDTPVKCGEYISTCHNTPDFRKGQKHALRLVKALIKSQLEI